MPLTMRERMLAALRGEPSDRVPFAQYSGLAAPDEELWRELGRGNVGVIRWAGAHRVEHPNCTFEQTEIERDGKPGFRRTLRTPEGELHEERLYEPTYHTAAAATHFVKEPDDYRILLSFVRDSRVTPDGGSIRQATAAVGDDGLVMTPVARTPYQQLWIQWVSLEDLCLHLVDEPELMAEVTAALADQEREIFRAVLAASEDAPIAYVDFPDNITAPTIGETNFRTYNLPLYRELSGMLVERGIPVFCHMDGDLRALREAIGESGLGGLDSFSPAPDNDMTVADAVGAWPGMRLFLNFPSSVHLAAPDAVYERARRILDEGARTGRMCIQISENVPPGVWRRSFPQILRAIEDFGPPLG